MGIRPFFGSRWRCEVPLGRLFWRDLIAVGTAINVASSAAALAFLGAKLPLALVLAVHFAPVPYNIFLTCAVWRTAEKTGGAKGWAMTLGATLWLVLTAVV